LAPRETIGAAKPARPAGPFGTPVDPTALLRLFERLSVRKRAADLATLRTIIAPSADLRLLDVGGGAGSATERVANGCREIVVLEPNPRKVALGRRQRPAIRFEEGRGEAIPFPDASFDRVLAIVSFHHMPDQPRALVEMHRVLRPGGRVALLELPPGREPGRIRRWLAGFKHGDPVAFLDPGVLRQMLEAAGFRHPSVVSGAQSYIVTATKSPEPARDASDPQRSTLK
jgi:SAM-dependent methyltransferase